jgi:hypothetical protein
LAVWLILGVNLSKPALRRFPASEICPQNNLQKAFIPETSLVIILIMAKMGIAQFCLTLLKVGTKIDQQDRTRMSEHATILLAYVVFIWLVVLHTFEEIASGIFDFQLGHLKPGKNRYLLAAGGISTLNMITLALLILDHPAGRFIGLFTTAIFGVLQGIVHTVGYFREGRKAQGLGAGFYSAIPLTIMGAMTFYLLAKSMF